MALDFSNESESEQGQGETWGGTLRAILFMPLEMADDDDVGKRGRGERG